MVDWLRFDKALFRCLTYAEIAKAQRIAHVNLRDVLPESVSIYSGFPGLTDAAFTFSTQGYIALILERQTTKGRSGFWWLHHIANQEVFGYEPALEEINFLESFSNQMKPLRDQLLFHVGTAGLPNPRKFRANTGITYDDVDHAIDLTLKILRHMLQLRRSSATWTQGTANISCLDYDGSDVGRIFNSD